MSVSPPEYDLYAIRYATREANRRDNFIGGDPHEGPMPMDYFVWLAVTGERAVVIDTGFTREVAERRKRTFLRCPVQSLGLLGVQPEMVADVVVTHLHYDHAGNFDRFANARFHIQEAELQFATGRYMRYPRLSHSFEVEDVCGFVRMNYARRVVFYDGDAEMAPGIRLHRAGGHSAGLQFASVNTRRGWVVVASDVSHFYANMESGRPFPTAFHVGEMLEGFDLLYRVAPSPHHIVPGHDPEVMQRYAAVEGLEGVAVRLDSSPDAHVSS